MERNTLIKRLRGVMAMMLAVLLLAGNPLIAQARTIGDGLADLTEGLVLNEGDLILAYVTGGLGEVYIDNNCIPHHDPSYFIESGDVFYFCVPDGMKLQFQYATTPQKGNRLCDKYYYFINLNGRNSQADDTAPAATTSTPPDHFHDYEWITTIDPTATTDGLSEYRCNCGAVAASQPIPYTSFLVKQILSDIKNAPQNGTVTINYDGLRCLSKKMIETLSARPDVTLVVQFTDNGETRRFTIPAGQAPTDGADWYGYYYLGALYGWQ